MTLPGVFGRSGSLTASMKVSCHMVRTLYFCTTLDIDPSSRRLPWQCCHHVGQLFFLWGCPQINSGTLQEVPLPAFLVLVVMMFWMNPSCGYRVAGLSSPLDLSFSLSIIGSASFICSLALCSLSIAWMMLEVIEACDSCTFCKEKSLYVYQPPWSPY